MPAMFVILEGDGAWPDTVGRVLGGKMHDVTAVMVLQGGMESGAHSVTVRIDLPDGKVVLAQTSLKLFITAAKMFQARYGDTGEHSHHDN